MISKEKQPYKFAHYDVVGGDYTAILWVSRRMRTERFGVDKQKYTLWVRDNVTDPFRKSGGSKIVETDWTESYAWMRKHYRMEFYGFENEPPNPELILET